MSVRVLLVDDHPLVLDALRQAVQHDAELEVHTAISLETARTALRQLAPNVIVCDVRLTDGSGLRLIDEARTIASGPACIVLSSFETPQYIATAKQLGAAGYLLKTDPTDTIIEAIRQVAAGGTAFGRLADAGSEPIRLTYREREVVAGVMSGETNDEIAHDLGITRKGVEAHLSRVYDRFGVVGRTELALRAEREGWLEAD